MVERSVHALCCCTPPAQWLGVENGPKELEQLFRAIVFQPAAPILIADNDRNYRDASTGAGKLLGLAREKIIGRKLDDFAEPTFKPQISELWRAFLDAGEHEGTLRLKGPDGNLRDVAYTAKGNVLPVRHVLVLHEKTPPSSDCGCRRDAWHQIPAWVQDYALFLLDADGRIVTWYSGAERIYGYTCRRGRRAARCRFSIPATTRLDSQSLHEELVRVRRRRSLRQ